MDAQSARWLDESIEALHAATAAIRELGVEILSAGASTRSTPSIHVVDPGPIPQTARYVRCVLDRSIHYAVPFMGCEVVWIDPPLSPAPPTNFPTINERTAEHG